MGGIARKEVTDRAVSSAKPLFFFWNASGECRNEAGRALKLRGAAVLRCEKHERHLALPDSSLEIGLIRHSSCPEDGYSAYAASGWPSMPTGRADTGSRRGQVPQKLDQNAFGTLLLFFRPISIPSFPAGRRESRTSNGYPCFGLCFLSL